MEKVSVGKKKSRRSTWIFDGENWAENSFMKEKKKVG